MVDHELNFIPNELEYLQEKAYIATERNILEQQMWLEEQQKMITMKKVKKPAGIKYQKPISEKDEYFRNWSSYKYDNDLLIINGKGHHLI